MPKRQFAFDRYELAVAAYRARPGALRHCAKMAQCDIRTAKKLWETGLVGNPDPRCHKSIRELLQEEQNAARAQLAEAQAAAKRIQESEQARKRAEEHNKAVHDAAKGRAEEAGMIRLARASATQLLATSAQLSGSLTKVAIKVKSVIEDMANPVDDAGNPRKLEVKDAHNVVNLMTKLTQAARQASEVAHKAMEMERLLLGEPGKIVQHQVSVEGMHVDELAQRMALAAKAVAVMKARGVNVLTDGHAADGTQVQVLAPEPAQKAHTTGAPPPVDFLDKQG